MVEPAPPSRGVPLAFSRLVKMTELMVPLFVTGNDADTGPNIPPVSERLLMGKFPFALPFTMAMPVPAPVRPGRVANWNVSDPV